MKKKIVLDWNKYIEKSRRAVAEGVVLVKNENSALPLKKGAKIAVFGRMQNHYYKSGTGSGGLVNVSKVIGIFDALKASQNVIVDKDLAEIYEKWEAENPLERCVGWGSEPWSQKEMPLDENVVRAASKRADTAVVIIARTAGEEQDATLSEGSYLFTELEEDMLKKVRGCFKTVAVVLNVGGIIDMSFVEKFDPDAVLYAWQGGMVGGLGVADVLLGTVSPSGRLSDTIAYSIEDYPSNKFFGNPDKNYYCEDIFVGYRYFETFAPEKVLYPFGFGLSYTSFEIKTESAENNGTKISLKVSVKNTGNASSKQVVQVYLEAPCGLLGKAKRVLCAYKKTRTLKPGETQTVEIKFDLRDFASYDDSNKTSNEFCYVLESGEYRIYVGENVRSAAQAHIVTLDKTVVTERLSQALAPNEPFERFCAYTDANGKVQLKTESVPLSRVDEAERTIASVPQEIVQTPKKGIRLCDVKSGKCTMDEFAAQLDDADLCCIIRGEGMGSPKVTPGTAAAFGGVSKSLESLGVPCACCSDGPSGMRLDCGAKAFSLPNGTLLACTFNTELCEELFELMGLEMAANNVDFLLGPGMNIHRHPLNGRNFEYFSEDPYLTGTMAAAQLIGMHRSGADGTIKHFCANNQETRRHFVDSVVSERALREIYLKGFEIAIKTAKPKTVMTTYGKVNGLYTAANVDLTTTILRGEWGFDGAAVTDWWANIAERGSEIDRDNLAAMAKAQNDVYMVCPDGEGTLGKDNTLASLENGTLLRAQLQRNAKNILRAVIGTRAMDRLLGDEPVIEIINRHEDEESIDFSNVEFHKVEKSTVIDFSGISTEGQTSFVFGLDVQNTGVYKVFLSAKSDLSELAQIPVTLFCMGTPDAVYTFNGTNGEYVELQRAVNMFSRFVTCRFYFAQSGLQLAAMRLEYDKEATEKIMR